MAAQFRGPPNSANGGYACGMLGREIAGACTAFLRAPVPLDTPLSLVRDGAGVKLLDGAGALVGEAAPAQAGSLGEAPAAPSLAAALEAGRGFPGLKRSFHPICFTCGDQLADGEGLRVFTGQVAGAPAGFVAGVWTPDASFADTAGLVATEVVWAALDCPGSVAWVVQEGGGGLLGSMTCEVRRRPGAGEPCIVAAWPIEQSGRKRLSGTALYSAEGELMAVSRQIWIGRAPEAKAA